MSKSDEAYKYLKRKIITGEYQPLMDLSEEEIQKALNISRTPVREAMQLLKTDDLILIYPQKGTVVAPVTVKLIRDVYSVRKLIEPYLCQCVIETVQDLSVFINLRSKLEHVPDLCNPQSRTDFISIDAELHWTLLKYCNNPFIVSTMSKILDHSDRFRCLSSDPIKDKSIQEHIRIIDAILSNDVKSAKQAALKHICHSEKNTIYKFSLNPNINVPSQLAAQRNHLTEPSF